MTVSTRPQRPGASSARPRPMGAPPAAAGSPSSPASPPPAAKRDMAGLFRAYRALPLDEVLAKAGFQAGADGVFALPGGARVRLLEGQGMWERMDTDVRGRGAIDLVMAILDARSTGQALAWLGRNFPDTRPAPPPAGGAVRPSGAVPGQPRRDYWTREQRDALFERYKDIRLDLVLERLEAVPNQDGDSSKWKIEGVGNIIVKGQRWQNVNTEKDKGYGGPSLVAHAKRFEFRTQGLKWMMKEFGEEFGDDVLAGEIQEGPKAFNPPERFPETSPKIVDYLVRERSLPAHLVEELVAGGSVYGSHPWNEERGRYLTFINRCVFLGPASAELRDTTPDGFKGCCEGSQNHGSGFSVRPVAEVAEHLVAMTEAAIDAISYRALFPGRFVMSTNGAGRFTLQYRVAREAVERGFGVRMALDADLAGDIPSQKIFNAFYVRKALSHHLKVPEDTVDEWIDEGDLILVVDPSPHQLFFNTGWAPELPVHTARSVPAADGEKTVWVASGQLARPTIRLDVRRDLHERLRRGDMTLTVSQAGFDYVARTLNVRRDRPPGVKDWNQYLENLGSKFSLAYNTLARNNFADGLPELPAEIQALRDPPKPPEPGPPARPNPPSAAPAVGGPSSTRPSRPGR